MSKRDYYEVLGITKTATADEIKKAYRKLSKQTHPDVGGDAEAFKEIAEAYEVLSDDNKKSKYDVYGHAGPQQQAYDPMQDFMRRSGFGMRQNKGQNMNLTVKLTLEDIFNGVTKKFKYHKRGDCGTCSNKGGTGVKPCSHCNGAGVVMEVFRTQFGEIRNASTCEVCQGSGNTYETICHTCGGEGTINIEEQIEVNVPSGVVDGMAFVMQGKGHSIKNGTAGDLVITIIELRHDKFLRVGNDLKIKVPLEYYQLILGDKVEIPTIEGGKIRATVNPYSKVNEILRIPTKGMRQLNSTNRGDMLLELGLIVDSTIGTEELELINQLKNLKGKVASE
jgi:molecular chaperone DnaJ